ncbi:MAG: type II toxin-antitoxin system RelE/ParE family toxin [bacterium]|nr:type II toxin-antitoxin system RelE/ParE family toxin [bacterium]
MPGPEILFRITYHPTVRKDDIPALPKAARDQIRRPIEERLTKAPQEYGQPLRKTLKGYWKLRVGDYRVVFRIEGTEVIVLVIKHRKDVYGDAEGRGK